MKNMAFLKFNKMQNRHPDPNVNILIHHILRNHPGPLLTKQKQMNMEGNGMR